MAISRVLDNGLNVKDDTRLANATQKLTSNSFADAYSFNTSVQPVMIAGIEENPTLSTVDLITCIRDQNGVNRLCVDNRGVAVPTKEQTLFFGQFIADAGTLTYDILMQLLDKFPIGGIIYLNKWIFSNSSTDATNHIIDFTFNGNACLEVIIPKMSTISIDFPLIFNPGDSMVIANTGVTATTDIVSISGIVQ